MLTDASGIRMKLGLPQETPMAVSPPVAFAVVQTRRMLVAASNTAFDYPDVK